MTPESRKFQYRNCHFRLAVVAGDGDSFVGHVRYEHGLPGIEALALPIDADPYGSAEEAWRHAEQQAVRWVHDRTGDGQGRF